MFENKALKKIFEHKREGSRGVMEILSGRAS
jgi:hypothetical protein